MNYWILKYSSCTFLNVRDKSFQTLSKLNKKLNPMAIQPMKDLYHPWFLDLRFRGAIQHVSRPGYYYNVKPTVDSYRVNLVNILTTPK